MSLSYHVINLSFPLVLGKFVFANGTELGSLLCQPIERSAIAMLMKMLIFMGCFGLCFNGVIGLETETETLHKLLDEYDIRTRPEVEKKPVKVEVTGQIQQFKDIKESTMEYSSSVFLIQTWKDPRLKHNFTGTLSLNGEEVTKRIWTPDTYVPNSNQFILNGKNQLAVISKNGTVYYSARIRIVAACQMFLQNFPMDVQECEMKIESYAYPIEHMQLAWNKTKQPIIVINTQMAEFEIADISCTSENVTYKAGKYTRLKATFTFERRMGFYLIQVYLPSLIITMLSWLSLFIDPRDIGDRVSLGITTILTIVFLLGTNNSSMPRVSYAKAIDWYLITSFMFVFATLVESLVVFKFSCYDDMLKEHDEKKAKVTEGYKPNNVMREDSMKQEATSPCLVDENGDTRRTGYAHNDLYRRSHGSIVLPKCFTRAALYNSRCNFSVSHMIDRVCRVLFPVLFAFVNIMYWGLLATH